MQVILIEALFYSLGSGESSLLVIVAYVGKRLSRTQNQLGSSNKKLRISYNRVKDLTTRRLSLSKLPSQKVLQVVCNLVQPIQSSSSCSPPHTTGAISFSFSP